jgi:hypothetical protein
MLLTLWKGKNMTALLFALLATVVAADRPSAELFAFDNAVGRGQWTSAQ